MSKKLTHEEFLEKLYEKNEYYRNGEFVVVGEFSGVNSYITVVDNDGLEYSIFAGNLLTNSRPSARNAVNKTKYIITRFKAIHGDKYNYDNVVYSGVNTPISLICDIHGDFTIWPSNHLSGSGCLKCSHKSTSEKMSITREEFINISNIVHNNKYNYDKSNYTDRSSSITITCPIHGDFSTMARKHINGTGCTKCKRMLSQEDFVNRSNLAHDNKYSYERFIYQGLGSKSIITCPIHGDFLQSAANHMKGSGCKKCVLERQSKAMIGGDFNTLSYSKWGDIGSKSKNFDSFKVYIIVCNNDEESFIKIGKTFNKLKVRLKGFPYNTSTYKLIIKDDPIEISEIECNLKRGLKPYTYTTLKSFCGQFECFSIDALHSGEVDKLIKNYTDVSG